MRHIFAICASGILMLAVLVSPAGAKSPTTVDCGADPAALQPAITSAGAGATLVIRGTCVGHFRVLRDLTLIGAGKHAALVSTDILYGPDPILYVGPGATVDVDGLTIRGGKSDLPGGGIANDGTMTLRHTLVTDNAGDNGGGIANRGTMTLRRTRVTHNAVGQGSNGGIANQGGTLTLSHSTVSYNYAERRAGGIGGGTVVVRSSVISHNVAVRSDGGGIADAQLTMSDSVIRGNSAADGGGIANSTGSIRYSAIVDNIATGFGTNPPMGHGGISACEGLALRRVTFSGNQPDDGC